MPILVDHQPFAGTCEPRATVRQFAREACLRHPAGRRILVGLRSGGRDLSPAEIQASLDLCVAEVDGLELLTADLREQVGLALQEAMAALDDAENRLNGVADTLEQGRQTAGMRDLAGVLGLFRQLQDTVQTAAGLLDVPLDEPSNEGTSAPSCLDRIKRPLEELKASVAGQDLVQVADLLRYDFGPSLAGWRTLLTRLASVADAPPAA